MNQLWKETFYGRKKWGNYRVMRRYTLNDKPKCNLKMKWAKDAHTCVCVWI